MALWPSFPEGSTVERGCNLDADVSSTNHVHPGSSHPRQVASGVPLNTSASFLPAGPSWSVSPPGPAALICLSAPLRPPADQPLAQAGAGASFLVLLLGVVRLAPLKSGSDTGFNVSRA